MAAAEWDGGHLITIIQESGGGSAVRRRRRSRLKHTQPLARGDAISSTLTLQGYLARGQVDVKYLRYSHLPPTFHTV